MLDEALENASVADKVAGKAAALLCVQAKVKAVFAQVLSGNAKEVFEKCAIYHEWNELVENILNICVTDTCPFEKLAKEIANPKDAYRKLKLLQQSLKQDKMTAK